MINESNRNRIIETIKNSIGISFKDLRDKHPLIPIEEFKRILIISSRLGAIDIVAGKYFIKQSTDIDKTDSSPYTQNMSMEVFAEVANERVRQDKKWGGANHDDTHPVYSWVRMIKDYAGWARQMESMGSIGKARRRLVQVAALAIAAIESIDRRFPQAKEEPNQ